MKENAMMYSVIGDRPLLSRGKVRDVYDLGDALLFVATDRISCFDVVLPTPIPGKGRVLTQMSRFWLVDGYEPGKPPPSFDKQYVRDWLENIGWNKKPPAPSLPADIVERTSQKYREALRQLTGET